MASNTTHTTHTHAHTGGTQRKRKSQALSTYKHKLHQVSGYMMEFISAHVLLDYGLKEA